uniref:Uncharacterized protein n=1 Tax=Arundo donax TaxID=35708 RepID=A0A0A9BGX0_ARUDO
MFWFRLPCEDVAQDRIMGMFGSLASLSSLACTKKDCLASSSERKSLSC